MKRSRSVRAYVVRLVVAVALPLLAFGAFLLIRSAHNEQQAVATTAEERAQGAAEDLDRELHNLQDLLLLVASSDFISAAEFAAPNFTANPLWKDRAFGLVVWDLSGTVRFNSCHIDAQQLPVSKIRETLAESDKYSGPFISYLIGEPVNSKSFLTINLPVWRENKLAYMLSLCALPRIFQILTEQHLPDGWTAMVVDREGRAIAGTSSKDKDGISNQWENTDPAYRASSGVALAGWTVTVDVPDPAFFGPVRRSLLILLIAGGGTTMLVLVLAYKMGRRIAGPMADLTGIARALGSGARVAPRLTGINEADLVAHALCSTSEDLSRRTTELTETVGALRQSEKRLQLLSDDLRRALDERTRLLDRTVSAQEDERQRVARELHDQLGQYFATMLLGLDMANRTWKQKDEVDQRIAELKTITSAMSREVHQLSWELRPTALDDLGLEPAIANYLERWSARFNLDVDFAGNLQGRRLSAPLEITLYRVLQEAMTNVAKHAKAKTISVILEADSDEVRLIVEDDGSGFVQERSGVAGAANGFGLLGMRERLALVGGSLAIETAPCSGTALFCRIPA